jgi:peptide/nickel transport system substrate-binding protein
MGPALAESWQESEDGLTYDFKLRPNLTFHNGDKLTTEDVKFSFDRYQGAGATILKEKVASVEIVDPVVIRFHLKEIWPDFMTFYGSTASAAGLVVPKKYIERVGDEEFKKKPVGAGPYKFASTTPGVELVLEAFDKYWRKKPNVKNVIMRSVPDVDSRALMVKTGEADIAAALESVAAQGLIDNPGTRIVPSKHASCQWIEFPDQWDPKSRWHDIRMRQAVAYAINREGISKVACLGFCPPAGVIVPRVMEFALQVPPFPYDPKKAKQLLAEAGHPNGFDAGEFNADASYSNVAEALLNNFAEIGIRTRLRPLERAAFFKAYGDKSLKNIVYGGSGAFGNAATRLEAFFVKGGTYVYGSYPDIDEMFQQQAVELDHKKRTAILHRMQQLTYERSIYAPIWLLGFLNGVGPQVGESGFGLLPGFAYTAPYEDITIKDS